MTDPLHDLTDAHLQAALDASHNVAYTPADIRAEPESWGVILTLARQIAANDKQGEAMRLLATELANMICWRSTPEQRKRDVAEIMVAMDACRIETLERAIAAAVAEMVDAVATQDESDFAYNRGCSDCAAAIEELKGKSDE